MSNAQARGPSALATWIPSVVTLILTTLAIERARPEAPYGYQMALWLLLLVTPLVYTILAWYEGPGSDGEATGGDP